MPKTGIPFIAFDRPIPALPDFKGLELLHFTDTSFGNFLLHTHDVLEMILVLDGDIDVLVEGARYHAPRGSLISIPPYLMHHTVLPADIKRYDRLVLHVNPAFVRELIRRFQIAESRFDFFSEVQVFDNTPDNLYLFRNLFDRIRASSRQDETFQAIVVPCLTMELFAELEVRLHAQNKPVSVTNDLVDLVIDRINERFQNPELTVEELTSGAYVSRGYLSRVFKTYTGCSIHQYLTQTRLEYAKNCMQSGTSVLTACVACGFSDYPSFLKAFKKAFHATPRSYCKQIGLPEPKPNL